MRHLADHSLRYHVLSDVFKPHLKKRPPHPSGKKVEKGPHSSPDPGIMSLPPLEETTILPYSIAIVRSCQENFSRELRSQGVVWLCCCSQRVAATAPTLRYSAGKPLKGRSFPCGVPTSSVALARAIRPHQNGGPSPCGSINADSYFDFSIPGGYKEISDIDKNELKKFQQ
jgi:hypothetical protein